MSVIYSKVFFLIFLNVLEIKVSVGGSSHICVSGSQVLQVNFGDGPIQQCAVMNTTPASHNHKPNCASEKAKEQAKSTEGWCVRMEESVKCIIIFIVIILI